MAEELIFTSSEQGLDPGASGYCTVARTAGIGKPLQQALESLSRYEPLFLPGDPRANDNPVNFRHIVLTVGGQRWHVLSRVAYFGRDYTGRNNQLAHQIALTPQETKQFSQGPGWLMHQTGFFRSEWDGQIGILPQRNLQFHSTGGTNWNCRKWEELMSDPGWAGWLIDMARDGSQRTCGLLVDPGVNTLRLMSEALELLPEEERWSVNFCTNALDLQSGCILNGFIRGTRLAEEASARLMGRVIDVRPGQMLPPDRAFLLGPIGANRRTILVH